MSSYEFVLNENKNLKTYIAEQKQMGSTFTQKNDFLNKRMKIIETINLIFLFIYCGFFLLLLFFLFQTKKLKIFFKIFLFLFFLFFPFIIYYIENQIYHLGLYSYSLIFGKVYNTGNL